MRAFSIIMAFALALAFSGCSSHAPSAAQFMNVKGGGSNIFVGGTYNLGDRYGGKYRLEDDYFADEVRFFLDLSLLFTAKNIVWGVSFENLSPLASLGYHWKNIGLLGWYGLVAGGDNSHEKPIAGGLMLAEEVHLTDGFRIGLSEHFSRNGYAIDLNGGGLGTPSTAFFNEIGVGIYLAYNDFSIEGKYGRDITEPQNRFYFMVNYMFHLK